jgi:hypothetical protein
MQKIQKKYKLFLDDMRNPLEAFSYTNYEPFKDDDWLIVRNYEQFVETIENKFFHLNAFPEIIAFDHDLAQEHYDVVNLGCDCNSMPENFGFEEKTGYDCADWLVKFCMDNELELPNYYYHYMNPARKENILMLLKNFEKYQNTNE